MPDTRLTIKLPRKQVQDIVTVLDASAEQLWYSYDDSYPDSVCGENYKKHATRLESIAAKLMKQLPGERFE